MPSVAEAGAMTLGQAAFAAAVLDPAAAVPAGLTAPAGGAADKRFAVYRNNVTVGLIDALADTFPAIVRLLGERFFRAMARVYVADHPPASPLIFEYGRDFPDFIAGFEPARKHFYLADVARLERLWLDAYHAADADPISPADLATVTPESLAETRFRAHPATRLMRSRFAAASIFSANRSGAASLVGIDPTVPEDALITRPECNVEVRNLPPGGAAFLTALCGGQTLAAAAGMAASEAADFDLSMAIAAMLQAGAFCMVIAPALVAAEGEQT